MNKPVLYDYWRSSATYRLRIALAICDIEFDRVVVDLLKGEHKSDAHLSRNPQGLVPALEIDGHTLTQSVAILEYLAEQHPETGLMPNGSLDRHRVRTLCHAIAMEIHPVCNLGVIKYAMGLGEDGDQIRLEWFHKFIGEGLSGYEGLLRQRPETAFSFGDTPTIADICLMPQLYNARRWKVDLSQMDRILAIEEHCNQLPAFQVAHPKMVAPPR